MSNLIDFSNPTANRPIETWAGRIYGTNHASFVDSDQTLTLNSNTRLVRILPTISGSMFDDSVNISLDGTSTSIGSKSAGSWNNPAGVITLKFGYAKESNIVTNQPIVYREFKVNGGETFKFSLSTNIGVDLNDDGVFIIEQWGY